MPHFPKPYFRQSRRSWFVQINGHERAGQRVMQGISVFITGRLKLKVNTFKTKRGV